MAEGEEVDFKSVREDWNVFECEDGTKLRAKLIVQKIVRLIDRCTPTGEPVYCIQSHNVVVTDVQPHLMMDR
jgi:hypothetical protein